MTRQEGPRARRAAAAHSVRKVLLWRRAWGPRLPAGERGLQRKARLPGARSWLGEHSPQRACGFGVWVGGLVPVA